MALFDDRFSPSLRLSFQPLGQTFALKLAPSEVQGFAESVEPTQADADTVAAKLEELHDSLAPTQQIVLRQLMEQAAR